MAQWMLDRVMALHSLVTYPGAAPWASLTVDKHMVSEGHPGLGIQSLDGWRTWRFTRGRFLWVGPASTTRTALTTSIGTPLAGSESGRAGCQAAREMTRCLRQEREALLGICKRSRPCGQCHHLKRPSDIGLSCIMASFIVLFSFPHAFTKLFPSLMILCFWRGMVVTHCLFMCDKVFVYRQQKLILG